MQQIETFHVIKEKLMAMPSVKQVMELGSLREPHLLDEWSDVDVGVIIDESAFEHFYPSLDWLRPLGNIYAFNQSTDGHKNTTRVVFDDGSRVDFSVAVNEATLSEASSAVSSQKQQDALAVLANDFKFEAFLAVSKIARKDLLIGMHLVLELERKSLVVAMMLRDRHAGTIAHRHGGTHNEVVAEFKDLGVTPHELLDRIENASQLFGRLAAKLDPENYWDAAPITRFIDQVRPSLSET